MALKSYRPTSAGRRFGQSPDLSEVTSAEPEKSLCGPIRKTGGRDAFGHTTSRFRGGGHKRLYRWIDFRRDKDGIPGRIVGIEYDPNRSARIALVHYADGEKRYILAPKGLKVGQEVVSGEKVEPRIGNAMPLRNIPLGLYVHNVELQQGRGGQLGRSAGSMVQLLAKDGRYCSLLLPSGEMRKVFYECRATIGQIGNIDHCNRSLGKAGRARWLGRRPHQRGTSQNPVSHPMGGGEGRTKGGRHPCSPWGKPSKGGKTRSPRKPSGAFVIRRRKRRR